MTMEVLAPGEAIHQSQELGHHPFFHLPPYHLFPLGGDGINPIEKHDAGTFPGRLLENLAQMGFGFPIKLVDDLGPAHRKKVGLGGRGDGPGDEGLTTPGGAMQQYPIGSACTRHRGWLETRSKGYFLALSDCRLS